MPRRLTIKGGFTVDDGRRRDLQQQARRLGFADLRGCLRDLLDDGWSIPQLATHLHTTHLHTTQPAIRRAINDQHLSQPPRREQLARQRQRAAQQRAADRAAELGFATVCGPTWWIGWSPRRGRLRRWWASLASRPPPCGACWISMRPARGADPGSSAPLPQQPADLSRSAQLNHLRLRGHRPRRSAVRVALPPDRW